jgi:hypothetical protein
MNGVVARLQQSLDQRIAGKEIDKARIMHGQRRDDEGRDFWGFAMATKAAHAQRAITPHRSVSKSETFSLSCAIQMVPELRHPILRMFRKIAGREGLLHFRHEENDLEKVRIEKSKRKTLGIGSEAEGFLQTEL